MHCDLKMCLAPQRRVIFRHSNFKDWSGNVGALCILTCECASRNSGVPFFDSGPSKIAPMLSCFVHFDLQMCFAPQRPAIFHCAAEHLLPHSAAVPSLRSEHPEPRIMIRDFPDISCVCIFFLVTLLAC